ncbi:hypothetical protein ACFSTC_32160 [Nonomuraea ferruginea]
MTVQLTQSARVAGAAAFTVFFAAYLLRGVSDLGGPGMEWLGWLVPNGWFLRARAFGGEQWWVFALVAAFVAAMAWAAYALSARRDLGAGLLPPRLGPARAPAEPARTARAGLADAPGGGTGVDRGRRLHRRGARARRADRRRDVRSERSAGLLGRAHGRGRSRADLLQARRVRAGGVLRLPVRDHDGAAPARRRGHRAFSCPAR